MILRNQAAAVMQGMALVAAAGSLVALGVRAVLKYSHRYSEGCHGGGTAADASACGRCAESCWQLYRLETRHSCRCQLTAARVPRDRAKSRLTCCAPAELFLMPACLLQLPARQALGVHLAGALAGAHQLMTAVL